MSECCIGDSSSKGSRGWPLPPLRSTVTHDTHTLHVNLNCMLVKSMQAFLTNGYIPYSNKIVMILFGRVAIDMMLCICEYVSFFVSAI